VIEKFKKVMRHLMRTVPHTNIVNCDETSWRLYPNGILTWARAGSDGVAVEIMGDEKMSITAMATITADTKGRNKLPLYLIAKGKTKRVEISQLGEIGVHQADHSQSGWQTVDTMKRYIAWLHQTMRSRGTTGDIHLILDVYRAHMAPEVRELAEQNSIVLHFIPAGFTDYYQPLDRRVFGCLKATARGYYLRNAMDGEKSPLTKKDAVAILIKSWEKLSECAMESAWRIYREDGNESDYSENEPVRFESEAEPSDYASDPESNHE
jgi:hypothetical protein